MNGNYSDGRIPDMNIRDEMHERLMGKENPDTYQTNRTNMGNMRQRTTGSGDVEPIYMELDEHMAKGLCFHEQLADYFCFLGLQGFKRMLEYQYMNECADKRKLHRKYIERHHKILPVQQIQAPMFIPQSWSNYTTENIDDGVIPKFVKSAIAEWKQWEERTKELYQKAWQNLKDMGYATDAEHVKELVKGVEKELKDIHRISETLSGTGYDVNMIHGIQDKYHEKYKAKYNEKYKKNKTKEPTTAEWDRPHRIGY